MQNITYTIDAGLPLTLWRGIPAQITLKGIPDVSGDWLFLIDTDWIDGVAISGTVTASGADLIVTLSETNTEELAHAIQGREAIPARATLTDGTSRVYLIPLTIRNRAVEGTPVPVAEYYTKAQIDALIAGITAESIGALPEPETAGTPGQVLTVTEDGSAWQDPPAAGVSSVNGETGDVILDASDVEAVSLDGMELDDLTSGVIPAPGKVYTLSPSADVEITLPVPVSGMTNAFRLRITMPDPAVAVTWPAGIIWRFAIPALTAGTTTELGFAWTGENWEGWAVPDLSEYARLSGGNTLAGAQTVNGNVTINGILDILRVGSTYSATIHMGTPTSYSLTITADGQRIGFGYQAAASGNFGSLAVGYQTNATGGYGCFSVGHGIVNATQSGTVIGKYNVSTTAAFVVGGGTAATDRKNISVIDWSGNMTIAGDLTFTPAGKAATTLTALEARIAALEAAQN